ncbi:PAS domain-containing protein [Planctomycetota bacterium]
MTNREKTHPKTKGTKSFLGPYHEWFERAPAGYFILDRSGEITDVNQTGLSLLGWPREQVIGKSFADFIAPEDHGHFSLHLYEVTKSGQASCYDVTLLCRDGRHCEVELRSTPALDATGKHVTGCLTLVSEAAERQDQIAKLRGLYSESERRRQRDVSDLAHSSIFLQQEVFNHEQTEAILAQTSELFEKVFSTSYLAIACLDCEFNYIRVNPAYAYAYGQAPAFFLDKPYFDLYPNDDLKAHFTQVMVSGVPYTAFAVPFVTKTENIETMTWWDWNASTLVDRDGRAEGLLLCLVDVSARVRLEHKIVHVTDQEQKRLGQELHDGMGQLLTAVSIKNKILEEIVREKIPEVIPHVQEVGELVREAAVQTRDLSKLLNPRIVEALGLIPALESLATETQRRLGVSCKFTWDEPLETLDPVVSNHLFRMAQESVTNALRHGPAQNIRITFNLNDGIRVLRIENDSRPFDPSQAAKSDGLGVHGMRYRAEMIGASYSIAPGPEGGTVVTCTLPKPEIALNVDRENT